MYDDLLTKNILLIARDIGTKEIRQRANKHGRSDLFSMECNARGYIGALCSKGYTVTIEKDGKKYVLPKDLK